MLGAGDRRRAFPAIERDVPYYLLTVQDFVYTILENYSCSLVVLRTIAASIPETWSCVLLHSGMMRVEPMRLRDADRADYALASTLDMQNAWLHKVATHVSMAFMAISLSLIHI